MPKGMAGSAYFQWNYKSSVIIERKGFDSYTNRFFAKMVHRYSYPYIPYDAKRKSGAHMCDNVRIQANKQRGMIVYQSWYAKFLHEGISPSGTPVKFSKEGHPLATKAWERAAWRAHKAEMLAELDAYRKKRSRQNSG